MKRFRNTALAALATMTLCACTKEDMPAEDRDAAWASQAAADCPSIAPVVRAAWIDGKFSIADLERVQGALEVAQASAVKGQPCAPKDITPPSTRDDPNRYAMPIVMPVIVPSR